jgi:hypothetical protein
VGVVAAVRQHRDSEERNSRQQLHPGQTQQQQPTEVGANSRKRSWCQGSFKAGQKKELLPRQRRRGGAPQAHLQGVGARTDTDRCSGWMRACNRKRGSDGLAGCTFIFRAMAVLGSIHLCSPVPAHGEQAAKWKRWQMPLSRQIDQDGCCQVWAAAECGGARPDDASRHQLHPCSVSESCQRVRHEGF